MRAEGSREEILFPVWQALFIIDDDNGDAFALLKTYRIDDIP